MKYDGDGRSKFLNHRQWRDFVTAVHESVAIPCAITYPKIINALRSSHGAADADTVAATLVSA